MGTMGSGFDFQDPRVAVQGGAVPNGLAQPGQTVQNVPGWLPMSLMMSTNGGIDEDLAEKSYRFSADCSSTPSSRCL